MQRYRPDGTLDAVASVRATNSTPCGFGGPDLDLLFVTRARTGLKPERLWSELHAGFNGRFRLLKEWPRDYRARFRQQPVRETRSRPRYGRFSYLSGTNVWSVSGGRT